MDHKYVIQVGEQLYGINYHDNDHLLFAYMGHTLAEIQSFESMQKNATKTLGQIASVVKSHLKDDELSEKLTIVKDKRNYFIHGFLRHYGWPMLMDTKKERDSKYIQAVEEMEVLQKDLREVHEKLGKHVAEKNLAKIGYATMSADGEIEVIADNVA